MAFQVINSSEIEVGDPLKKELFNKIKNSFDDHETRLNGVEASAKKIGLFKGTIRNAASFSSATGLILLPITDEFTVTECYLQIFEKGTLTGSLEIDVKKAATLNGTYTSIFTTKPKITLSGVSDYAKSTNQIFNPAQIGVLPNNFLRVDITSFPSGGVLGKFILVLYGE